MVGVRNTDKHHNLKAVIAYTLVYLMVEAIIYCGFVRDGITLIWNADALGQYYPAFLYVGQYGRTVLHGLISGTFALPGFDLSIGMGEDVIGALNYYGFGDPINILALFATKANGPLVYTVSYFLRLWLGGLAFLYYCNRMGLRRWPAVLGALIYIASGWPIVGGVRYVAWTSALIYTPLMMTGAEELIRKTGRYRLFVFSIIFGALCGFYFLYMSSLALGVYCLIRVGCTYGFKKSGGRRIIMRLLGFYCVGIVIVSPVFYPAVKAFFNSERTIDIHAVLTTWYLYKPSLQRIRDFCMLSIKPDDFNYMLGVLVVEYLVILLYLVRTRQARRRQIVMSLIVSLVVVMLPMSDWLFNGFAEANLRWVYILHMMLAVIFVAALSDETILPVSVTASQQGQRIILASICVLAIANMIYNGWGIYYERGANWIAEFSTDDEVTTYLETPTYDTGLSDQSELYRIANDTFSDINGRPENLGMINNYYGLTYWFSIINYNTQMYVNQSDNSALEHRSFGFPRSPYTEALAGCKYYISAEELIGTAYEFDHTFEDVTGKMWYLYRNPYYVGMAYCISDPEVTYTYEDSTEETNAALYATIVPDAVTSIDYDKEHDACRIGVSCDTDARLVLAFPDSSEWHAYVDGKQVPVEMFGMYLSVAVGEGTHTVEFRYTSTFRQVCCIMSAVLLMAILVDSVRTTRRCKTLTNGS